MKNKIPNALRKYRKLNKMLQSDVAQKLGLKSTDRISHWEKGLTFPHPVNLFKLSIIYKVPPHELYGELLENIKTEMKSSSMVSLPGSLSLNHTDKVRSYLDG